MRTWCRGLLIVLFCLPTIAADSQPLEPSALLTGDGFVDALAERLELDWNACPARLQGLEGDVRCAVIGRGDPRREAERLAILQAGRGGQVLDLDYDDGVPKHLLTTLPGFRSTARVLGFDRLAYLLGQKRVSLWVQLAPQPLVEGGEPERWVAVRVDELEGPFPDYIPADSPKAP